jgi:hypothetical protein
MQRLFVTGLLTALLALGWTGTAAAQGGSYVFDGGDSYERTQVRSALRVSSFNWSVVPERIVVHIAPDLPCSTASPGEIWLDSNLLDAGTFSWAIVQHEYAHQVDFFLFDDADRAFLQPKILGFSWWQNGMLPHDQVTSERFASTLSWAYWPSRKNSLRPSSPNDESAAMAPAKFRALITQVLATAE